MQAWKRLPTKIHEFESRSNDNINLCSVTKNKFNVVQAQKRLPTEIHEFEMCAERHEIVQNKNGKFETVLDEINILFL